MHFGGHSSLIIFVLAYFNHGRDDFIVDQWYNPFAYFGGSTFSSIMKTVWFLLVVIFSISFITRIYQRFGDKDI